MRKVAIGHGARALRAEVFESAEAMAEEAAGTILEGITAAGGVHGIRSSMAGELHLRVPATARVPG